MIKRVVFQSDPVKTAAPPRKRSKTLPWIPKALGQSSKPAYYHREVRQKSHPSHSSGGRAYNDQKKKESSEVKVIKMISGGSIDGDSNRARKAWSRKESLGVSSRSKEEGPVIIWTQGSE